MNTHAHTENLTNGTQSDQIGVRRAHVSCIVVLSPGGWQTRTMELNDQALNIAFLGLQANTA